MNYVIYYFNAAGFPAFALACEDDIRAVKNHFKMFYPDCKIQKIYVAVDDMRDFLVRSIS